MTTFNNPKPAAGYNVNSFQEIKSHSAWLFNERLALLFYIVDMDNLALHTYYRVDDMLKVKSELWQVYKNFRMLLRYNPICRASLNLDTKENGVYVTDVAFEMINQMVEFCEVNGYTTKRIYVLVKELDRVEIMLRDVLQYYHYFLRPDFRQKPDIEIATEQYKEIADDKTIDELKQVIGKNNRIDFDSLGATRIPFDMPNEPKSIEQEEEFPEENIDEVEEEDEDGQDRPV